MIDLRLGDCLEVMRDLPDGSVDAVVTDPPYGIGLGSKVNNERRRDTYASYDDSPEQLELLIHAVMPELLRISRRLILTPGVRNMWAWPKPTHVGVFYQPAGTGCNSWGFSCWQPIFYYGKDPYGARYPDSFQNTERAEKNGHPCPKPIGAWTKLLLRATKEGETILDPFMGSGTTGVACVNTGRNFIGIERDAGYFQIATERIRKAQEAHQLTMEGIA